MVTLLSTVRLFEVVKIVVLRVGKIQISRHKICICLPELLGNHFQLMLKVLQEILPFQGNICQHQTSSLLVHLWPHSKLDYYWLLQARSNHLQHLKKSNDVVHLTCQPSFKKGTLTYSRWPTALPASVLVIVVITNTQNQAQV